MSLIIVACAALAGFLLLIFHNKYCKTHDADSKTTKIASVMRFFVLLIFAIVGLYAGNLIHIGTTFYTAISHGMGVDPDTGKYELSYGEMLDLNKKSIKETNIDINELKNKAVIYVRYDCVDCIVLHDELASIQDVIFLSSRSKRGKAARELYDIHLTEVPQGVYIDPDGNAMNIIITEGYGDDLHIDMDQIDKLKNLIK